MKGCRPLDTNEILKISEQFDGTFEIRNRSLFMLGVSVGGRISELLALRIKDVWQNNQPVSDLLFQKDIVKGRETARMIPVNADGQKAICDIVRWHIERNRNLDAEVESHGEAEASPVCSIARDNTAKQRPLFPSRKLGGAVSRSQAHRILETAFQKAGLNGKLATHSLRKTFAQRIYDHSNDIFLVQELLGHRSVETTKEYLGISYTKMQRATEAIELRNRIGVLLHSIDKTSTGDLITELMTRGYDVSSIANQLQAERMPKKVAVAGAGGLRRHGTASKVIALPRREEI